MIVHHISSATFSGGAARAGYRLHESLAASGVSSLWVDASESAPKRPDILRLGPPPKLRKPSKWERMGEKIWGLAPDRREAKELGRQANAFYGLQTYASRSVAWGKASVFAPLPTPTAYNLHWVANFLHWADTLPALAARAPVFWTLHDLNPVCGAWHYDPYPDDLSAEREEWNRLELKRKADALAKVPRERLVFIAPSRWMARRCAESELTSGFRVEHVPNGIDTEVFRPLSRDMARAALGLPTEGRVVGFVGDSLDERRKGMAVLLEAVRGLRADRPATLLSVGGGAAETEAGWIHLGPLRDDRLLRLFYSACDLFVCPSWQDNLPNTVLEAMACGVPVVASDTGGIPDMVIPGETGWLAPPGDVAGLERALREALTDETRLAAAGRAARTRLAAEYDGARIAGLYRGLYVAGATASGA